MSQPSDWIPLKWPSGPLEIASLIRAGALNPQLNDALNDWHDPTALDLVVGTPINCLVLSWAAGLSQDEEQQRTLLPLIRRGQQAGLSFVGRVGKGAEKSVAVAQGQAAGLDAITLEEADGQGPGSSVIFWDRSSQRWNSHSPVRILNDTVWPQIRTNAAQKDGIPLAGPTGVPWIDSNGWLVRLEKTLNADKTIWLTFDPEEKGVRNADSYVVALADAEAFGGHWIISLDVALRAGLRRSDAQAVEKWKAIIDAAGFFKKHSAWKTFRPLNVLGVISTFSGEDEFIGREVLNLLCRRHLPFSIIAASRAATTSLDSLKAILYAELEPPAPELREKLLGFVNKGGLLVVPASWGIAGKLQPGGPQELYDLYSLGAGRLAVAKEEIEDPYVLAEETHFLLSHRNDLVRLWNAPAMNSFYTRSADDRTTLFQLVNYSHRQESDFASVWLSESYSSARFWRLSPSEPVSLQAKAEQGGQEFHLPPFSSYAAIELEKK